MKRKSKLLIIIILFISIGFAVLTASLYINANVSFQPSKWDVHFENIVVEEDSVEAENPIITDKTKISFNLTFSRPGDYYEFCVDVVNAGTMDAALNLISKSSLSAEQEKYINYNVRYYGDRLISENDILHAGYSEKIIVRVEYKYDINELASLGPVDFTLGLDYIKKDLEKDYKEEVWSIDYTGAEHTFTVPKDGTYKLETWGAQGGSMPNVNSGGYGAYATGNVKLSKNDLLFINVGGEGESSTTKESYHICKGGYNGGGDGGDDSRTSWSAGGGATHIATKAGELSTLENYLSNILIVSAGGGGSGWFWDSNYDINAGGAGGGITGNDGNGPFRGTGATQTEGGYAVPNPNDSEAQKSFNTYKDQINKGSFGKGSDFFYRSDSNIPICGGGGAGLYGGGSGYTHGSSGAGGSSYIANQLLTNKIMYCYKCTTSDVESTKTQTTENVSVEPISEYAKMGNGFVRVTLLESN